VSDDQIVAGSLLYDAGPTTANTGSPKLSWNAEPGDHCVIDDYEYVT